MKLRFQKHQALTVIEVLVIIAVLAVLAAVLLPILAGARGTPQRINCLSNLKQVALSFRIWEDDNNKFPMEISVTNGGAMELIVTGNVAACFFVMSNELSTPKILVCPEDWGRTAATNFGNDFNNSHISYFVGADITNEDFPQRVVSGDDNFQMNGAIVPSGVLQYVKRTPIGWSRGRHDDPSRIPFLGILLHHHYYGNIGFADGSVAQISTVGLQESLSFSGLTTNRLAIP